MCHAMQSKLGRARQHITQGTPDLAHRLLLPWIGWFTVTTPQVSITQTELRSSPIKSKFIS
jgi:hypothetical protein